MRIVYHTRWDMRCPTHENNKQTFLRFMLDKRGGGGPADLVRVRTILLY